MFDKMQVLNVSLVRVNLCNVICTLPYATIYPFEPIQISRVRNTALKTKSINPLYGIGPRLDKLDSGKNNYSGT